MVQEQLNILLESENKIYVTKESSNTRCNTRMMIGKFES